MDSFDVLLSAECLLLVTSCEALSLRVRHVLDRVVETFAARCLNSFGRWLVGIHAYSVG